MSLHSTTVCQPTGVVGFDTAHGFNRKSHDKNFVKTETMGLL